MSVPLICAVDGLLRVQRLVCVCNSSNNIISVSAHLDTGPVSR